MAATEADLPTPDQVSQVTNYLALLNDEETLQLKLDTMNTLLELSRNFEKKGPPDPEKFAWSLRLMIACAASRTVRTTALRLCRRYCRTPAVVKAIAASKVATFIAISMEKEKGTSSERTQALKLIRCMIDVSAAHVPRCLVQALVAVVETKDDPYCTPCVVTLAELAVLNPGLVGGTHGMRALLSVIVSMTPLVEPLQESLVVAMLYLLNDAASRNFIRPCQDLWTLLAPLSDGYSTDSPAEEKEKWCASQRALTIMLHSWVGIITLASDPLALSTVVKALSLKSLELVVTVVNGLYDIFRIPRPSAGDDPFHPQNLTHAAPATGKSSSAGGLNFQLDLPSRTLGLRHNLLNNYIAALLIAFIDSGLIEGLVELVDDLKNENENDNDAVIQQKRTLAISSTILIGELLHLSNKTLPPAQCARLQTLPTLVRSAVSFSLDPRLRSRASTMVTNLNHYAHMKGSAAPTTPATAQLVSGASRLRRIKGRDRRLDRLEDVKLQIDWNLDDAAFQGKLRETNLLTQKEPSKWNWDAISDLFEGPLTNPSHVQSALKTKLMKRLMSYIRPLNREFSLMPMGVEQSLRARIACQALEVLLSCDQGVAFLNESKFLTEIADALRLESEESKGGKDRLFLKENIMKTMAREYFTMLGLLSSSQNGLAAMKKFKFFEFLSPIMGISGREDLSLLIVTSLDYNNVGPSRILLARTLTGAKSAVRFLATRHLRVLLRAGVSGFADWVIKLLVKQLSDEDPKVVNEALSILDEACDDTECLESMIAKRPKLTDMGEKGKNLVIRFLSRSTGFAFLKEVNFVQAELNLWRQSGYIEYTCKLESLMAEMFSKTVWRTQKADGSEQAVNPPPHFYGELACTEEGCAVLSESNHFAEFCTILFDDKSPPLYRRASAWAIGQIGRSSSGFSIFVAKKQIVPMIVKITETSTCMSLRGTCFCVLGMISNTDAGRAVLSTLGWESPANLRACIAVPKMVRESSFLRLPPYKFHGSWAFEADDFPEADMDSIVQSYMSPDQGASEGDQADLTAEIRSAVSEIITFVGNLSNHIVAERAAKGLKMLRLKHPNLFRLPQLTFHLFRMVNHYKFKLQTRQFVYSLCDGFVASHENIDAYL